MFIAGTDRDFCSTRSDPGSTFRREKTKSGNRYFDMLIPNPGLFFDLELI